MARIRYVKSRINEGMLYSRGHIAKKYGTRYDVEINVIEYTFEIRNVTSNRVVKKGSVSKEIKYPKHAILIKAKKALKELLIDFGTEVRCVKR